MEKKSLTNSYLFLLVLIGILIVIYYKDPFGINALKDFSLNLITEIIGIFLVVFFIDRVISYDNENKRTKFQQIAFQQLRIPLTHHLQLLFNVFKASVESRPKKKYSNVSDLFDETYFAQIAYLDFSKKAPIWPHTDWSNHLARESIKFKQAISQTLDKYSIYLEPETIDLMEEIINSSFIYYISQIPNVRVFDKELGVERKYVFFAPNGACDLVKEYTNLFSKLINLYNLNVSENKKIKLEDHMWNNNTSPKIGDSRFKDEE